MLGVGVLLAALLQIFKFVLIRAGLHLDFFDDGAAEGDVFVDLLFLRLAIGDLFGAALGLIVFDRLFDVVGHAAQVSA